MAGDRPDWLDALETVADTLLTDTSSAAHTYNKTLPITKSYPNTLITLGLTGTNESLGITVTSLDVAGNTIGVRQGVYGCLTGQSVYVNLPIPLMAGGSLLVSVTTTGPNWTTLTINVYGVTFPAIAGSQLYRTDGRPYPKGDHAATFNGTGTGTLVAAPGTGLRIMLKTLDVVVVAGSTSATYALVTASIGLVAFNPMIVAAAANGANGKNAVYESGMLLDENTGLSVGVLISTPGAATYNCTYDVGE